MTELRYLEQMEAEVDAVVYEKEPICEGSSFSIKRIKPDDANAVYDKMVKVYTDDQFAHVNQDKLNKLVQRIKQLAFGRVFKHTILTDTEVKNYILGTVNTLYTIYNE